MSNKLILFSVATFLLLIVALFVGTTIQKQKSVISEPNVEGMTVTPVDYGISRIEAKHFFIDGVHTIVGELPMPTPCDLLNTTATVAESMPEQVSFNFSVINTTDSCEKVVTTQRFKVSATASKMANLSATFMGTPVSLNLVEAAAGETPDDFELFIKG